MKILRITNPDGRVNDVPNVEATRKFYEKMNSQQKDESKHYKLEVIEVVEPEKAEAAIKPETESEVTETSENDEVIEPEKAEAPKRGRKPTQSNE